MGGEELDRAHSVPRVEAGDFIVLGEGGMVEGTETPPSLRLLSTSRTDLPSFADCTAARLPEGPLPITSVS